MITYTKLRKLKAELAEARSTSDTLDERIAADDVVEYSDITSVPGSIYQVFYQATAPAPEVIDCVSYAVNAGDYWVDSDTNIRYRYDGETWNEIQPTMDYVPEGITYGKILQASLSEGAVLLSQVSGSLDDIADGTYAKVLASSISDGLVLLSGVTGNLDDVADGTSYGKIGKDYIDGEARILLASATGTIDDISDGDTYGKVLVTDISAGHILLSEADGDLDDIADGTYAKVLATDISAGHILLTEVTGDIDDIDDGETYGKILLTDISAGHILLAEAVGDIDDVDDGETYAKVLATDISAGHILLAETAGDLDDIADGSNYGKISITDISSGHILLSETVGSIDDIADGDDYSKVLTAALSSGSPLWSAITGTTKPDDYSGLTDSNLIKDPNFLQGYTDRQNGVTNTYWLKSTGADFWTGSGEGTEPVVVFFAQDPGQYVSIRPLGGGTIPCKQGDVFYTQARIYQSSVLNGTQGLSIQATVYDKDDTILEYLGFFDVSVNRNVWETVNGSFTITDADAVKMVVQIVLHNSNTAGTARCKYWYLSRANPLADVTADNPQSSAWLSDVDDGTYAMVGATYISAGRILLAQAADYGAGNYGLPAYTAISGGKIKLDSDGVTGTLATTLTAAKCTDADADQTMKEHTSGTLTLSSSAALAIESASGLSIESGGGILIKSGAGLEIQSGGGVTVNSGAGITLEAGGDFTLRPSDTDPAIILLEDSDGGSNHVEISREVTFDRIQIKPQVNSTCQFYLGESNTPLKFESMYFGATGGIVASVIDADNDQAELSLGPGYATFYVVNDASSISSQIELVTSTTLPGIRFITNYLSLINTSAAANVPNKSFYVSSSDNKLYWKDNSGTSHALY